MYPYLCLIAILLAGAGALSLSEATFGIGLIALACLMGIFARIAQATNHQHVNESRASGSPGAKQETI